MWRAFFCGIGISLCIVGAECLVVEKAVLAYATTEPQTGPYGYGPAPSQTTVKRREIVPAEWAPWGLISAGAVVFLYATTVAKKE